MITDDPHRWTGDTPTPSASTSGSSISTLTVDQPAYLSKCDVGETFESTYWAAIEKYWREDFAVDDVYNEEYELRLDEEDEDDELPLNGFDLVNVSLDDGSDLKAESLLEEEGFTKQVRRWWGTNVSMIIPEDQDLRDHFCKSSLFQLHTIPQPRAWWKEIVLIMSIANGSALEKTYLAYFRTAMSLAMSSAMLSQFYIFSPPTTDPHPLDFRDVGKPLAASCMILAIIVNVIGAARFNRAQDAVLNGKAITGGADLMLVGVLFGMVSIFQTLGGGPFPEVC